MSAAASVSETMTAINKALASSDYRCQTVSWDDVQRGTVGGGLSCWGANITDTRLWEKSGKQLYTVRSQNWNEKLGAVPASEIALMAGGVREGEAPTPVTLANFLARIGTHGTYANLDSDTDLSNKELDAKVSIRFQTTFLPVPDEELGALEFAPEMYNYQTRSDSDPKNLLLLCTTQGSAIQQDGKGAKKLFHHAVRPGDSEVCRYWFEAERTKHAVGGPQTETQEEKAAALARGKAVSAVIGTRAMGTRFNVLMTVQVPLAQKKAKPSSPFLQFKSWGGGGYSYPEADSDCLQSLSIDSACFAASSAARSKCASPPTKRSVRSLSVRSPPTERSVRRSAPAASAARVSRGSQVDTWGGLSLRTPQRDPQQHVTVTVVIYNTVAGGVPSAEDVAAAVADMDALYAACGWTGQLAEEGADFMKAELTVADALTIAEKVATQPYKPDSLAPENGNVFPTATPLQPLQANLLPETRDPSPPKKVKRTIFQRIFQAGKAIL